ncbi:hypothetical protein TYRP_001780 [Tyrophagus putrescentiae]|nr:hypothetical protein TYRP_001780 [Tyrophagus putrescentiae]
MSGPAAHPDVTWPLSTPSSSGLARCARKTLVTSPPWAGRCFPRNNGASPAAQGKNDSDNAQPKSQDFVYLGCLRSRRSGLCCPRTSSAFPPTQSSGSSERCENGSESAHCCDSVPRLRTAAKASATSAKTKDNVPNFLGFLVNHKV